MKKWLELVKSQTEINGREKNDKAEKKRKVKAILKLLNTVVQKKKVKSL